MPAPVNLNQVIHTRLDCTIGSAALIRQCAQFAAHHASTRHAFGGKLIEQPLMASVLTDLAVESEAANATWARLARAFENSEKDEHEATMRRVATAIGKYWVGSRDTAEMCVLKRTRGGAPAPRSRRISRRASRGAGVQARARRGVRGDGMLRR